jgi:hypothetical protein
MERTPVLTPPAPGLARWSTLLVALLAPFVSTGCVTSLLDDDDESTAPTEAATADSSPGDTSTTTARAGGAATTNAPASSRSLTDTLPEPFGYGPLTFTIDAVNAVPVTPDGQEIETVQIELRAANEADDLHRLLTSAFFLTAPDGARQTASRFFDTPDRGEADLQVDALATVDGALVFEVEEPFTTVEGWSLVIQAESEVGITVPLDGASRTDPTDYPISLTIPPSTTLSLANEADVPASLEDCQVLFEVTPRTGNVGVDLSTWEARAAPGTRLVEMEVDIGNVSDPQQICAGLAYTGDVPIRLAVDGIPVDPVGRADKSGVLGGGDTFSLWIVYEIPVTGSNLALLVGPADLNQVGLGSVSLPTFSTE